MKGYIILKKNNECLAQLRIMIRYNKDAFYLYEILSLQEECIYDEIQGLLKDYEVLKYWNMNIIIKLVLVLLINYMIIIRI